MDRNSSLSLSRARKRGIGKRPAPAHRNALTVATTLAYCRTVLPPLFWPVRSMRGPRVGRRILVGRRESSDDSMSVDPGRPSVEATPMPLVRLAHPTTLSQFVMLTWNSFSPSSFTTAVKPDILGSEYLRGKRGGGGRHVLASGVPGMGGGVSGGPSASFHHGTCAGLPSSMEAGRR